MAERLQIVHLEDNPLDAELVAVRLEREGVLADVQVVHSAADFEARLRERPPDLILADYALPGFDGLTALTLTRRLLPHVPYIFVTGEMGEELAIETLKQGATDYVLKTRLSRLPQAVRRAVAESRERAARRGAVAAARAERERLQVTLASIGDAVIATDIHERITLLNPVAQALTGWSAAEAVGQPVEVVFRILNELTRAAVESPVARVLREGVVAGLANHTVLLRRDGSEIPIDDSGAPIRDGQGQLMGVVLVFRDVTARRSAEQALRNAHDTAQLSAERLQRLLAVSARLAQAVTPQDVIKVAVRQGREAVGASAGVAFLREDERPEMRVVYAVEYPASILVRVVPLEEPAPATEALLSGEPVWIESRAELRARYPRRSGEGYEAVAAVPLVGHGRPRGVLGFSFAERKTFSPDERKLLTSLAQQCVQALERAELYEQAQRLNADLDERVRERTAALNAANSALATEMDQRRNVERKMEQWREAERERMAREVHDELGGNLTALKMDLARAARGADLPAAASSALNGAMNDIDTIIDMVRHVAYELRPAVLDQFGLLAALQVHFEQFLRHSGQDGEFETTLEELSLAPDAATACYRIFQEALTNVARHAQASRVMAQVTIDGGEGVVRVIDNGQGMAPDLLLNGGGRLGVVGMRERAQLFGGRLKISSAAGTGTTVELRLPLAA